MPRQADITERAQPLLPAWSKEDRPMFVILVILAFLATLTLLGVKSSYSQAGTWRAELQNTMTVQIKPAAGTEAQSVQTRAKQILSEQEAIQDITVLSEAYSRSLLDPWLGDVQLPDDIELPLLLGIDSKPGSELSISEIKSSLMESGIEANIDTHTQWNEQYKKSIFALQSLAIIVFILIFLAILAAIIFATRSGLTGRRMLIDVLHQIGAAPNYTARLFGTRFGLTGLKAGTMGSIAALAALLLLGILNVGASGNIQFLPSVTSSLSNIVIALAVPVFLAAVSAITAWRTVLKTLFDEVYP